MRRDRLIYLAGLCAVSIVMGLVGVLSRRAKIENQPIYSLGVGQSKFAEFCVTNLLELIFVDKAAHDNKCLCAISDGRHCRVIQTGIIAIPSVSLRGHYRDAPSNVSFLVKLNTGWVVGENHPSTWVNVRNYSVKRVRAKIESGAGPEILISKNQREYFSANEWWTAPIHSFDSEPRPLRQFHLLLHGLPLMIREICIHNRGARDYESQHIQATIPIPPPKELTKPLGYFVILIGFLLFGLGLFGVFIPQALFGRLLMLICLFGGPWIVWHALNLIFFGAWSVSVSVSASGAAVRL